MGHLVEVKRGNNWELGRIIDVFSRPTSSAGRSTGTNTSTSTTTSSSGGGGGRESCAGAQHDGADRSPAEEQVFKIRLEPLLHRTAQKKAALGLAASVGGSCGGGKTSRLRLARKTLLRGSASKDIRFLRDDDGRNCAGRANGNGDDKSSACDDAQRALSATASLANSSSSTATSSSSGDLSATSSSSTTSISSASGQSSAASSLARSHAENTNPFAIDPGDSLVNSHGLIEMVGVHRVNNVDWSCFPQAAQFMRGVQNRPQVSGLQNFGNRCYANAVLQCLTAALDASTMFRREIQVLFDAACDPSCKGAPITHTFAGLLLRLSAPSEMESEALIPCEASVSSSSVSPMTDVHSSLPQSKPIELKTAIVDPTAAVDAVALLHPRFRDGRQHDAHEFFVQTMNALDLETSDSLAAVLRQKDGVVPHAKSRVNPWRENLYGKLHQVVQQDRSDEGQEVIQPKGTEKLRCLHHSVRKHHDFLSLTVPIADAGCATGVNIVHGNDGEAGLCENSVVSLDACLRAAVRSEVLDGRNRWTCPQCQQSVRARISTTSVELPSTLVIHLNRFRQSKAGGEVTSGPAPAQQEHATGKKMYTGAETSVEQRVLQPRASEDLQKQPNPQQLMKRSSSFPSLWQKNRTRVDFPLEDLDFGSLLQEEDIRPLHTESGSPADRNVYDCVGVVYHLGGMMCGTQCALSASTFLWVPCRDSNNDFGITYGMICRSLYSSSAPKIFRETCVCVVYQMHWFPQ